MQNVTLGIIVGNRGFFPDHLCQTGRRTILEVLEEEGISAVIVGEEETTIGAVTTLAEARLCAERFKSERDRIDGILVTLPNFGEERAIANTIRFAGLDVPILVQAFPDDATAMTIRDRRDSFCGKMSTCNNLRQYGVPFSLTDLHTVDPTSPSFRADLRRFAAVCRVVRSLRGARIGAIGARPAAFNTVRYSEKLFEAAGISIDTLDLSEVFGRAARIDDDAATVKERVAAIRDYTSTATVPDTGLLRMAKLAAVIDEWMEENELVATAIQCWTSIEEFYGVVPCSVMSMMSNNQRASACETDIAGLVGMLALQEASQTPAALLDWNNNYGADPDKGVVFHCSNLPKAFFGEAKMDFQEIIAGSVGKENAWGTIVGRVQPGPFTFCRVSTDDGRGAIRSYCGEGRFTDDALETFGGYGVIEIPEFQSLLRRICAEGYEHHVAATRAEVAPAIAEAFETYLGWEVYHHEG